MTAVYLVLGLPGSGRHEIVTHLVEDGLQEPEAITVYHAADDAGPPNPDPKITFVPYKFAGGQFDVDLNAEPRDEPKEAFFIADGRRSVIDQLEAFPAWLRSRSWELARILLVVDCALASKHEVVEEWHTACVHFADCVLLNKRDADSHAWTQQFEKKFHDERYPCQFFGVKKGRVAHALVALYPEARRLTLAFDDLDAVDEMEFDEENLPEEPFNLERKPDPYFERLPSGQRRKQVPDVSAFLAK